MCIRDRYTSIPNNQGIEAVLEHIQNDPTAPIPLGYMEKLMKLILERNHFEFNGTLYLQTDGTAMGTRFAPSFANLYMGKFEKILMEKYDKPIKLWLRFIDDIFMVFEHGLEELDKFVTLANSLVDSIKFTIEHSPDSIVFLDTRTKVDPETRNMYTTLYMKPTDTRDFLLYSSSHPRRQKDEAPYGQFLRLRRICTKDWDFNIESRNLFLAYRKRGYPKNVLTAALQKASKYTQDDLLDKKTKESEDRTVFAVSFNPANPNIFDSVRKFWPLLSTDKHMGHLFQAPPLCANRRTMNLRDLLVRAKCEYPAIPKPELKPPKNTTCGTITCKYCKCLVHKNYIKSSALDLDFKPRILCKTSCLTPNVIYVITCQKCMSQYVGETKRQLRRRMYEHLKSIQEHGNAHAQSTPVSLHFNTICKRPAKLTFQIVETIRGDVEETQTTIYRKKREKWWILNLRSLDPLGINATV